MSYKIKIFNYPSGLSTSDESTNLYFKQEKRNAKLMKFLFIYATFVVITVYVPPLLFPIGYAIFGFPAPKKWYFPYPTVLVFYVPQLNYEKKPILN